MYIRWPSYLPLPYAIPRSRRPVPNAQSVNWPQSQFAPKYLPPGSPSFQPYVYPRGRDQVNLYGELGDLEEAKTTVSDWVRAHPIASIAIGLAGIYAFGTIVASK